MRVLDLGAGTGANLRATAPLIEAPQHWVLADNDVELLARFVQGRRGTDRPRAEDAIYEFALHEWRDVPGSKIRARDFFVALAEILRIRRRYFRDSA